MLLLTVEADSSPVGVERPSTEPNIWELQLMIPCDV